MRIMDSIVLSFTLQTSTGKPYFSVKCWLCIRRSRIYFYCSSFLSKGTANGKIFHLGELLFSFWQVFPAHFPVKEDADKKQRRLRVVQRYSRSVWVDSVDSIGSRRLTWTFIIGKNSRTLGKIRYHVELCGILNVLLFQETYSVQRSQTSVSCRCTAERYKHLHIRDFWKKCNVLVCRTHGYFLVRWGAMLRRQESVQSKPVDPTYVMSLNGYVCYPGCVSK